MKKPLKNSDNAVSLRKKAEQVLKNKYALTTTDPLAGAEPSSSEADTKKLLHDLEVHQIELEMQNEELQLAKQKAETIAEKYTTIYDFAPSGYFTLDSDFRIFELNFNGAKILGKERSKLIHSTITLFIAPDKRSHFIDFLERVAETKTKQSCEVEFTAPINTTIYAHIEGVFAETEQKYFLTVVDISGRKIIENELIKAKERAEESDRLKSAFLANMSHEIRTPMNGILGFSNLLKTPNLSGEEQQKFIEIIEISGKRMLNIINNIMNISKIEAGLMDMYITESNVNEQIEYIYTFFKPEAEVKEITLSFENSLPLEKAIVTTDREKVFAILTNLVKNALKFTEKGTIEIGYTKKGKYLEFYVKDTGIGIDIDRQAAIFERFVQADISDKKAFQGAGLGLAISKAYAEMLGGKLWMESKKGIGSIFYFTLPYGIETGEEEELVIDPIVKGLETPLKKLKIAIVDDDEMSRYLLDKMLGKISKEVLNAENGLEGVEILRDNPDIDLVLMDIKMPVMDGYEATRQIRKFNKKTFIIAQTAFSLEGDKEKAIEAGCNAYMSKPVNKANLLALLQKHFKE
ncbi:ATP-binding protein [Maribacter sp. ACAM166]|uniref:PAS domain-containing hybrid sensor histidine kinase/response regulator n=1 Tax=Maribacter sp. ACAM166 TaxID=2508996 RepID=UPI0010FEF5DF|nr:ATP-binding protein [Maribacter sp. ACAM166]TLP82198.1 response regulator [Maribacter sp. ACAM166]